MLLVVVFLADGMSEWVLIHSYQTILVQETGGRELVLWAVRSGPSLHVVLPLTSPSDLALSLRFPSLSSGDTDSYLAELLRRGGR